MSSRVGHIGDRRPAKIQGFPIVVSCTKVASAARFPRKQLNRFIVFARALGIFSDKHVHNLSVNFQFTSQLFKMSRPPRRSSVIDMSLDKIANFINFGVVHQQEYLDHLGLILLTKSPSSSTGEQHSTFPQIPACLTQTKHKSADSHPWSPTPSTIA